MQAGKANRQFFSKPFAASECRTEVQQEFRRLLESKIQWQ